MATEIESSVPQPMQLMTAIEQEMATAAWAEVTEHALNWLGSQGMTRDVVEARRLAYAQWLFYRGRIGVGDVRAAA